MKAEEERPVFSFAIITDTHLTVDEQFAEGGDGSSSKLTTLYKDLVDRVNAMNPEFVVHLGDMTDPVPVSPKFDESNQLFREISNPFSVPYHMVPGNHDVGEKIHPALPAINDQVSITTGNIDQYERAFGPARYSFEFKDCLFVVINTLLFNSGFEEERDQWDWLNRVLSENERKRIFVFAHYPMYLASRDEPDFYDNVEEPARSRIIELLEKNQVQAYFAGHVHNFFYDYLNGTHQIVLPSAGIVRTDYMEMFRATPTREMGSFDPAKLGFLWVDVYPDRFVPHLIRSSENLPYRTHSWNSTGSTVTMDLRIPWCDEVDIPCAWGLEIFERKDVRNDYPLAALWEMGITDLRIPISDLLKPRVSHRVNQLAVLGHKFTIVSFGIPDKARRAAIADHGEGIKAVEVVALFEQWNKFAPALQDLRQSGEFEVYLNVVRPEVEGWTTHHGLHTDLTDELKWVFEQADLTSSVDGFVFGIRRDVAPLDGFRSIQECLAATNFKPMLHIPSVGMYWSTKDNEELTENAENSRTAEAIMLARGYPDLSLVIDNFVELDRGYCGCRGLVDRFYNPKNGSRVTSSLNSLLPRQLSNMASLETPGGRVLTADHDGGTIVMVCESQSSTLNTLDGQVLHRLAGKTGKLTDLTNGFETHTSLSELISRQTSADEPQPPVLFRFER